MPRIGLQSQISKDIREYGIKTGFAYLKRASREAEHQFNLFHKNSAHDAQLSKSVVAPAAATMNKLLEVRDTVNALISNLRNQMPTEFLWPDQDAPKKETTDEK